MEQCNEAVHDDATWSHRVDELEEEWRQQCRSEAEPWNEEECDRLFRKLYIELQSYVVQGGQRENITYGVLRSWLPGEGFSASRKAVTLKRLWARVERQLDEWDAQ